MSEPTFSVIIPTYNRPDLLERAVGSVLAQTVDDLECIVVDDASPSPLPSFADSRVRVVRNAENSGEAVTRNRGIAEAEGRFVAFLDDDDLYTPDRLETASSGLEAAPVAICWRGDMSGEPSGNRDLNGHVGDTILDGLVPQVGQVTVSREICPEFDPSYEGASDVEWWLRLAESAPVATVPIVGLRYRMHDAPRHRNGTRARVQGSLRLLDARSDYFRSHRKAEAFRWMRIGLMAMSLQDRRLARKALGRSMRLHPAPRTAWHLARSIGRRYGTSSPGPNGDGS